MWHKHLLSRLRRLLSLETDQSLDFLWLTSNCRNHKTAVDCVKLTLFYLLLPYMPINCAEGKLYYFLQKPSVWNCTSISSIVLQLCSLNINVDCFTGIIAFSYDLKSENSIFISRGTYSFRQSDCETVQNFRQIQRYFINFLAEGRACTPWACKVIGN